MMGSARRKVNPRRPARRCAASVVQSGLMRLVASHRSAGAALPWLALAALWAYVCAPLLHGGDRLFIGGFSGDGIVTIWFYDLLGRSLPAAPGTLSDFDWPWPHETAAEFPSVTDAAIAGAVLRVLGWRAGWGVVQALALGINALGAAALARAAGARGAGVLLAGGLGLLCRQVWFDLVCARMNSAWPGFALLAVACSLLLLRRELRWPARLLLAGVGAVSGANAALIYAPQLLGIAPAGLLLAAVPVWRARWRERLWALAPAAAALAWVYPLIGDIAATRQGRRCALLDCPDRYHALDASWLVLQAPQPDGLSDPGLYWTAWAAVPLVLLSARRWRLLAVVAAAAPLVIVSLGPCPTWDGVPLEGWQALDAYRAQWCVLHQLSDYSRAATVAALLAAVVGGVGLRALPAPLAWAGCVAVLGTTLGLLWPEYLDPERWEAPVIPASAAFLRGAEVGPVVELPYDRSAQYLSVLEAPGAPRVNPLKPMPNVVGEAPVWRWVHALGTGAPDPGGAIAREALAAEGIRWVLFEPDRCEAVRERCAPDSVARLRAVLGPPSSASGGLLVWSLSE